MSRNTNNPSIWLVALHVFLTAVTGGGWLIVLLIWFLLKKK